MWLGPPACQIRITDRRGELEDFCAAAQAQQTGQRQAAEGQAADLEETAPTYAVAGAMTTADEFQHEDSLTWLLL